MEIQKKFYHPLHDKLYRYVWQTQTFHLFLDFTINIGISVDEGADGCSIDSLYDSVAYEHTNEPIKIKLT